MALPYMLCSLQGRGWGNKIDLYFVIYIIKQSRIFSPDASGPVQMFSSNATLHKMVVFRFSLKLFQVLCYVLCILFDFTRGIVYFDIFAISGFYQLSLKILSSRNKVV